MSTVIRVKRCLSEEPSDAVIVSCKRQKIGNDLDEVTTIFKRTTTVENQDDDISKYIKHTTKHKLEINYKVPVINLQNKLREQNEAAKKNNRYKVINLHRSAGTSSSTEAQKSDETDITIVDVEPNEAGDNLKKYVYDLYCANSNNTPEIDLDKLISVYPLSDDLVHYDDSLENEECTDDSDSNEENNWRNDYPDESDVESITEEDMVRAMNTMGLDEGNAFSSDDEDLVYNTNEDAEYYADLDTSDVDRYGKMYAKFKAKFGKADDDSYDNGDSSDNDN